ncbi:sugar phosphate isomerase/epimerase [Telmatocola sphagniphila]|uniref:Sugar phosphate isomerase/epimerase n=1 Tax=Telmatocola sphagniphila TaxID=1123043 RepID=A0A8E6B9A4_9BACT|nr:sugar phosphate isomerase/epimerase [Telmatocola sphagniphila]QVL34228.1 sugar phosphate isomerase/epimerase [Telmatocola sphagniphila]
MPQQILLFTNGWTDLALEELSAKASQWGYAGFELTCYPGFIDVGRASSDSSYLSQIRETLSRYDLRIGVVSNHKVSQAICDLIDERHKALLPEVIWGDGKPEGVRKRAIEEMVATIHLAQKLGVAVVSGFTGSPIWSYVAGYPAAPEKLISQAFKDFGKNFRPILEACRETGVKFAFEVHPGQMAFDLYSAEMVLDAVHGSEEFGFTFDPSHLHWQGVEPLEFLRAFPTRIYHVHAKDAILTLNGRAGILNSYLPSGDPRRGFQFRSPGHGSIDWESLFRELNTMKYTGAIAVDYHDRGIPRESGAQDACQFLKSFDILG